jgi:hypothetical protein
MLDAGKRSGREARRPKAGAMYGAQAAPSVVRLNGRAGGWLAADSSIEPSRRPDPEQGGTDRRHARDWIITNQLGRRNLTAEQKKSGL